MTEAVLTLETAVIVGALVAAAKYRWFVKPKPRSDRRRGPADRRKVPRGTPDRRYYA